MAIIVLDTNRVSTTVEAPTEEPSGTFTITANGTYNISNYEFVKIQIED